MTMTPQQWSRVKSIVMEALDLEPPKRAGYLARACEGDTGILREADSLLQVDGEGALPDPVAAAPTATCLPDSGGSMLVGRRVGRYRITRMIGMGGMGAVYEATRDDLSRPVALKVMRAGLISSAATARFQREANLLSRLDHPGIARIYDSGMHESELGPIPYFAMELIPEAISLTDFARQRKLSIRERVGMFAGICDAVHHGHQRGVIHRDLKPSNILVSESAPLGSSLTIEATEPMSLPPNSEFAAKVIDFGVARSTDADMTLASFESAPSGMAGTLAYMSPEQTAFDPADIDTRSDVYGLGVVLYELLAGRLPYDLTDKSLPEAIRIIQESPAAKPSMIEPILSGEPSVILLKCLAKDRELRYDSASELAEDLRRWLADLPIAALPASRLYAMRLFARRNRPLVLAGCVAASAVLVGLASTSVALHRAVVERDRAREAESIAREQQSRTDRVAEFVQGVLRSTSAPMMASQFRDPEISPIAVGNVSLSPSSAVAGKAESLREVVERARRSLASGALHDAKLAAELRMLTLQLLITQTGTSDENNEVMRTGPDEIRAAARDLGAMHPRVLATSLMLTGMMSGSGLIDDASRLIREEYDAARKELGAGDPRTLELGRQLVRLMERDDLADERRTLADQIVRDAVAAHGQRSRVTLACQLEVARTAVSEGRLVEAGNAGRDAIVRLGPGASDADDLVGAALELSIADVPRIPATMESLTRIAEVQRRVLRAARERSRGDARMTFDAATPLVSTLVQLGEFGQAADVMREVASESRASLSPTFHVTTKSQSRVARLLVWGDGDLGEALEFANAAASNSVHDSGQPLGDYEVFDRATVFEVRRAMGEPDVALEGVDRLINEYRAVSRDQLSWFGGYLHGIAAQSLEGLGRVDEARTRWSEAIMEVESQQPPAGVLRVIVIREAWKFFAKHGPSARSIELNERLRECYVGKP